MRDKLPPVASILSPLDGSEISNPVVTIRYSARSQEPIIGLRVLVDGRPVAAGDGPKLVKESGELPVSIPSRDCEVSSSRRTAEE